MKITHSNFSNPSPLKLKINLENMPFTISRRVLVPEDVNMMQLHFIVQLAMGWQFAHLFQFSDKKENPSIIACLPWEEANEYLFFGRPVQQLKADEVKLKEEFKIARDSKPFWYWYDFGDSWYHKITFQKPAKKDIEMFTGTPLCVEAFGACPPENVGGPWGYSDFLNAVTNSKHSEYREWREWAGIPLRGKYDPDFADLNKINQNLAGYFKSSEWKITADRYFEGG